MTHSRPGTRAALLAGTAAGWLALSAAALAQEAKAAAPAAAAAPQRQSFLFYLFGGGGVSGVACTAPILAMSVAAMALVVEHMITVRRGVLMPHGLAEELHGFIAQANFVRAEQECKLRPSFLTYVVQAGLQEVRMGYAAVDKAMEEASVVQAAAIFRRVEFLSVAANIATMLGLFGTVVGLVIAFKQVADTQGVARASDLAGGIYLALMTTIEGLVVAIPCVAAHALFKYRADQFVAEATLLAEYAFSGFKRARLNRPPADSAKPARSAGGS
jgi:biopolymer transport protein ExbB